MNFKKNQPLFKILWKEEEKGNNSRGTEQGNVGAQFYQLILNEDRDRNNYIDNYGHTGTNND